MIAGFQNLQSFNDGQTKKVSVFALEDASGGWRPCSSKSSTNQDRDRELRFGQGQVVTMVHDASGTGWWWSPQPTRSVDSKNSQCRQAAGRQGNGGVSWPLEFQPMVSTPAGRMRSFAGRMAWYTGSTRKRCARVPQAQAPRSGISGAFSSICERFLNGEFTEELRFNYGADWLQAVASILGMLMHPVRSAGLFEPISCTMTGGRQQFSTYPTAPAVAALAAEHVVALAFRGAAPRVIDPSMESGQLLLAVAEACSGG